ncbi:MFS transporter [Falsirhodobacter algicola]|uniref:MFS transporter n=1 Tax=Falsirhodobacter algicola TaxID=2692330 RepID=A0A8J8SM76_9RHOB|nr:MFS transporter [Falsirhodobacter algicola]QUS37288.1 MFS transporter [Falsirhodobacter algicola]
MADVQTAATPVPDRRAEVTTYSVILAISLCHFVNDVLQSLLSAIYPVLKADFALDYWQIGMLTLIFQCTASLLQPVVGIATDRRPAPMSLPIGMAASFVGLLVLAFAPGYGVLLAGAALIGIGSAVFHPEASRVARMASGGRFGVAQSIFQVGGNAGQAAGPLLAAFVVVPLGRPSVAAFCVLAAAGIAILYRVGRWYGEYARTRGKVLADRTLPLPRKRIILALTVLAFLTFSKNAYMASLSSYYTFYLIESFGVSTQTSQVMLFLFLGAVAAGTLLGGPIGDRFGTTAVIWFSILGALPFTLALPHVGLAGSAVLTMIIGFIIASSFPAIVVTAQELLPGRVGMVAGIFFGLAFGMGGLAAAALGLAADAHGIRAVYHACAWLPALGVLTILLPRRHEFAR